MAELSTQTVTVLEIKDGKLKIGLQCSQRGLVASAELDAQCDGAGRVEIPLAPAIIDQIASTARPTRAVERQNKDEQKKLAEKAEESADAAATTEDAPPKERRRR